MIDWIYSPSLDDFERPAPNPMQMPLTSSVSKLRSLATAAAFVCALAASATAVAQEGEGSSGEGASSSGEASAAESESAPSGDQAGGGAGEASEGASGEQQQAEGEGEQGPDPDDPHYWAKVRKIQTVQKRQFQKVNRFSATVYGGVIPNNIFEQYFPVGIRLNYFILENIGVELAGSRSFESSTSLRGVLEEPDGINADSIKVADSQVWHTNFGILWSPSYGKAAFYDDAIGYFDMYLFGGAGMVVTKTPEFPNQPESDEPQTIKAEGVLGFGLAWYLNQNLSVRADFRQFLFRKNPDVGGVANPSEISFGAGWFF